MGISYKKQKNRWLWRVDGVTGCFSTNRDGEGIYYSRGSRIRELIAPNDFTVAYFVDMSAKNKIRKAMNEKVLPELNCVKQAI